MKNNIDTNFYKYKSFMIMFLFSITINLLFDLWNFTNVSDLLHCCTFGSSIYSYLSNF